GVRRRATAAARRAAAEPARPRTSRARERPADRGRAWRARSTRRAAPPPPARAQARPRSPRARWTWRATSEPPHSGRVNPRRATIHSGRDERWGGPCRDPRTVTEGIRGAPRSTRGATSVGGGRLAACAERPRVLETPRDPLRARRRAAAAGGQRGRYPGR